MSLEIKEKWLKYADLNDTIIIYQKISMNLRTKFEFACGRKELMNASDIMVSVKNH